jgi:outer membrane protein TolC
MKLPRRLVLESLLISASLCQVSADGYSLQECKDLAFTNNAGVQSAALEVAGSDQLKKSALTKFFPQVNLQAYYFALEDPLLDATFGGFDLPVFSGAPDGPATPTGFAHVPEIPISAADKGAVGLLTATQPIFSGGRIVNGYRLAGLGKEIDEMKLTLEKKAVGLGTEERYWQIVALRVKTKTLDAHIALLDTLYKETEDAFNAGTRIRNDVMKASVRRTDAEDQRIKLTNDIHLAARAFCQYLGIPYDSAMSLTDTLPAMPSPGELYADPQAALPRRYEYQLLQKADKVERLRTDLKIGEYLPQIGGGGGGVYQTVVGSDKFNAFLYAQAKVPISAWWEAPFAIRERRIREKIARVNNQDTIDQLRLQIDRSFTELEEQFRAIGLAEERLQQATENLRVNNDKYRAGVIDISDKLEALTLFRQRQDELLDARIGYKTRMDMYLQATGR